jgi:protocatechuate 3,4-dioxygenase beta subunit
MWNKGVLMKASVDGGKRIIVIAMKERIPGRRRNFLGAVIVVAASAATLPARVLAQGARLAPTPECKPGRTTPAQTEGPYYSPRTPLKANFRADAPGEPIVLQGFVLTTQCKPLAGAWLDFWHADSTGAYDNAGFRLRGHQVADAEGRFRLETILPAIYPGRARHIHVKVSAREGSRILTTQTYFPDEAGNARDGLYRPGLEARRSGEILRMDFVLPG